MAGSSSLSGSRPSSGSFTDALTRSLSELSLDDSKDHSYEEIKTPDIHGHVSPSFCVSPVRLTPDFFSVVPWEERICGLIKRLHSYPAPAKRKGDHLVYSIPFFCTRSFLIVCMFLCCMQGERVICHLAIITFDKRHLLMSLVNLI